MDQQITAVIVNRKENKLKVCRGGLTRWFGGGGGGGVETTEINTELNKDKKMFYLMTHSTHFIYGYMTLDIW